jgi:hypothetical protein
MLFIRIRAYCPGYLCAILLKNEVSGAVLCHAILHNDERSSPCAGRVRSDQAYGGEYQKK